MLVCFYRLVAYLLLPSSCLSALRQSACSSAYTVWLLVCVLQSACLSAFYSLVACLVACLLLLSASLLAYLLTTCLLSRLSISVTLELLNMRFCAVAHATWNAGTLACFE